ncbi:MAG: hypothetical protein WCD86_20035, partial [Ktedonobacteraceae bacterium]
AGQAHAPTKKHLDRTSHSTYYSGSFGHEIGAYQERGRRSFRLGIRSRAARSAAKIVLFEYRVKGRGSTSIQVIGLGIVEASVQRIRTAK